MVFCKSCIGMKVHFGPVQTYCVRFSFMWWCHQLLRLHSTDDEWM